MLHRLQKCGKSSVSSLGSMATELFISTFFNDFSPMLLHFLLQLSLRAQLGAKSEQLLKKGKSVPDILLVNIMVNAIKYVLQFPFSYLFMCLYVTYVHVCENVYANGRGLRLTSGIASFFFPYPWNWSPIQTVNCT